MKAFSIRQPWAWLIIKGEKTIENRGWLSHYRGPLCIHAALIFDKEGYRWVKRNFPHIKMLKPKQFACGAIIGYVDMIGCIQPEEDYHSPWFSGPYGFLFRNPVELESPIPYKGQLGLFEVPEKIIKGGFYE